MSEIEKEMVERMARAILQAAYPVQSEHAAGQFDALTDQGREWYRAQAIATLEAMREPTEAMVVVGADRIGLSDYYAIKGWRVMIDEALK